ncbi:MAG: fasciclin domain-containing protein [Pseudomonadota bacterium]
MFRSFIAGALAISIAGCAATANNTTPKADIVDTAVSAGQFQTLVAAVQAAGLVDTLKGPGPFTVFAPNDDAFAKLPAGTVETLLQPENRDQLVTLLTYHVVPGRVTAGQLAGQQTTADTVEGRAVAIDGTDGVTVNSSTVIAADVMATNGVIHVIDSVLMPSDAPVQKTGTGDADIVDTAIAAGDFQTLVAAVQAAGLVDTLKGEGPFTVFAPTDAAFARLKQGTVQKWLKPENKELLNQVLTYHVVPGLVTSDQLVGKQLQADTVEGTPLNIDARNGVKVNRSNVVAADVAASNGVIHVIDRVLLPFH